MANIVTDPNISNQNIDIVALISQALSQSTTPVVSAPSVATPAPAPISGIVTSTQSAKTCCGSCASGGACEGNRWEKYEPVLWLIIFGLVIYAITMKK